MADSLPWVIKIANQIASKHHFRQIGNEESELLRNLPADKILKKLGVSKWRLPFLAAQIRSVIGKYIKDIHLFEGVNDVLVKLSSNGVVLAVASSNSKKNIKKILGDSIAPLIQYYECGVTLTGKSARIRKILQRTKMKKEETILIGDEIRDGRAAQEIGVAFGAVAWGFTHAEALMTCSPEYLFIKPTDILSAILKDTMHG